MLRIWVKLRESIEYKNYFICDLDILEIKLVVRDIERLLLYYLSKYGKNVKIWRFLLEKENFLIWN